MRPEGSREAHDLRARFEVGERRVAGERVATRIQREVQCLGGERGIAGDNQTVAEQRVGQPIATAERNVAQR